MVNFRKLADRATKARDLVEKQGGTDALKAKADRIRDVAKGQGTMGERAKAAAAVAREKPNPAAPTAGDTVSKPGSTDPVDTAVGETPPADR